MTFLTRKPICVCLSATEIILPGSFVQNTFSFIKPAHSSLLTASCFTLTNKTVSPANKKIALRLQVMSYI
jgi:hypothetical protein